MEAVTAPVLPLVSCGVFVSCSWQCCQGSWAKIHAWQYWFSVLVWCFLFILFLQFIFIGFNLFDCCSYSHVFIQMHVIVPFLLHNLCMGLWPVIKLMYWLKSGLLLSMQVLYVFCIQCIWLLIWCYWPLELYLTSFYDILYVFVFLILKLIILFDFLKQWCNSKVPVISIH